MNQNMVQLFKSLGDENRLALLEMLAAGQTCGCTLLKDISITQPTLSYHLRVLTELGLTVAYKEGTWKKHYINIQKIDEIIAYFNKIKEMAGESHDE